MKNSIVIFISLLFALRSGTLYGQTLSGRVVEKSGGQEKSLPGVSVFWKGRSLASASDTAGYFSIAYPDSLPAELIFSLAGYTPDTLMIAGIKTELLSVFLKGSILLEEVEVQGRIKSTSVSTFSPVNTEVITSKELLKAACCNLSESFTTNATVDVAFTDAISGAKKIQMLGLDGVYTQILSEQVPLIRGLSSSYGINYVPGTWIESILVTKGTGSVVHGYESISGLINIEFKKPQEVKERLFVNGYGSQRGRLEANVHLGKKFSDKWSTLLFTHASDVSQKLDRNMDGFLDMPLTRQYNVYNRWNYHSGKRIEGQLGLKALMESRQGGQASFNYNTDYKTTRSYGLGVNTRQVEYFSKTGILYPDKPWQSIGIITSGRWMSLDSYFGLRTYSGEQKSFSANGIFQSILGNTNHKYKAGLSFLLDEYNEVFSDSAFSRTEQVPGIFAEYTLTQGEKITMVTGVRADRHNLYGLIVTPRVHFKYNIRPLTAVRLSGGSGFRTANIFVENTSAFASSRKIILTGKLLPEKAWNSGASITHKVELDEKEFSLNLDYFYTHFENQVVADRETPGVLSFYNLSGKSWSHSLQADAGLTLMERLDLRLSYKWYDIRTAYSGTLRSRPLIPRDRALLNLSYATLHEIWKFSFTASWFGVSRLPDTQSNPILYRLPEKSAPYFIFNSQVTKAFRYVELYLGAENIMDFMQKDAILAPDDPFGSNFDASMIWGPLDGRLIYAGFRFRLE